MRDRDAPYMFAGPQQLAFEGAMANLGLPIVKDVCDGSPTGVGFVPNVSLPLGPSRVEGESDKISW